jgi:GNAT superfamily N-acetyltransferase
MLEFKVLNSSHEELEDFSLPFAKLLTEATQLGASMGFLESTPESVFVSFWERLLSDVRRGKAKIIYAQSDSDVVGVIALALEQNPNASHRAELKKLIVAESMRGQGIATKLLSLAEMEARISGRSLLVLDTESESDAEYLYRKTGWVEVGQIPDHSAIPSGQLRPTTLFYKLLD